MKTSGLVNFRGTGIIFLLIILVLITSYSFKKNAAAPDESFAKFRKGELIVQAKKGSKVRVEQLSHEFWFGCAIPNSFAGGMKESDLKQFKEHFLMNFNCAVPENSMKWITMERTQGKPQYAVTDSILKWCDENNLPVRGHNIFWGKSKYVQPWLMNMSDGELKKALQKRAESLATYYKGRFAEYDLNNEMLDENYYETRLGPEITKQMAEWVHNADQDAKLFLNEHDIFLPLEPAGNKLAICMTLIRKLLSQGVKIDGIGIQGHSHLLTFDRQALKDGLDSIAKFNIPIRITEFNMPGRGYPADEKRFPLTPEQETAKAKEITDFYRICFAHPAVEGILMWGFWEGSNWIQASSLYKRDWTPNPAADAYRNLVFNEWWTKTEGIAGNNGVYSIPAFYGKYRVTVNGVSKTVVLSKKEGKATADFRN